MTSTDNDLHLFLGRVEGKLDLLVSSQSAATEKIGSLSERVTSLEARRSAVKEWGAILVSLLAALAATYANLKGFFH